MAFQYTLPKLPSTGSSVFGGSDPFGTSSATGFSGGAVHHVFQYPTLTTRQLAQIQYNLSHQKHESFLDRVKHGAGFTLDHTLDLLSRGDYASAGFTFHVEDVLNKHGSTLHALESGLHGAVAGIKGHEKHTYADVIAKSQTPFGKWLQSHSKTSFAVGLGLDIALDPTTYIGAGLVGKAAKEGAFAVKFGKDAIAGERAAHSTEASIRSAQQAERSARLAPDLALQAEHSAAKEASRATAQHESNHLRDIISNVGADAAEQAASHRYVQFRFGPTRASSLHIRTPLKLKTTQLQRIEKLTGKAAAGSTIAKIKADFKTKFHAGWDMPIIHAMQRTAVTHGFRMWATRHYHAIDQLLKPFSEKNSEHFLSEEAQTKALAAADKVGTVDAKTGNIVQSELDKHLEMQGFHRGTGELQKASAFIHAYHAATERLMHFNEAAGVQLEEDARYAHTEGRVYVPRRVNPEHELGARFSLPELARTQGIQKYRAAGGRDFEAILKGLADGSIKQGTALTHPSEIVAQMIHESSMAQVTALFKDSVRKTFGTHAKIFDRSLGDNEFAKQIKEHQFELSDLMRQRAANTVEHLTAAAAQEFANTRDGNKAIRVAEGNKIKAAQAEIDRSAPLGKSVERVTPEARAQIKAKSPERTMLAKQNRDLTKQLTASKKPPTSAELMVMQSDQRAYIEKIKEQLYNVEHTKETKGYGLEPSTESAIHAEDLNSTAPSAVAHSWEEGFRNLTEPQGAALEQYLATSEHVSAILDANRGIAIDPMDGGAEAMVHDLDAAFRAFPGSPQDFYAYHGTQFARKGGIPKAGETLDVHTFTSTSTHPEVAKAWAGHADVNHPAFLGGSDTIANGYAAQNLMGAEPFKAVYRIKVKKGTRTIGNLTGFDDGATIDEVILQRGGQFKVRSVSEPDRHGIHRVDVEFVPPKDASQDASQLRRQLKRAEATLDDPEALKRKWKSTNALRGRRQIVRNKMDAMDATARELAPTGRYKDISFYEKHAPGGRGKKGGSSTTFQTEGGTGFLHLGINGKKATVGLVRVLPEYQKQGIGRELYTAAVAYMEHKGMNNLVPSDLQSTEGQAMWASLRKNPPKGWKVAEDGSLVRDGYENLRVARLYKQIKDSQRTIDTLPPAKEVRMEHAQRLVDIANDPKRIKSEAEMDKRAEILKKSIANLRPKALQAMYKDNPKAFEDDLRHSIALDTKGIGGITHEYTVPGAMAGHLNRVMEAMLSPKKQGEIGRMMSKAMTEWKKMVTVVNPGYHLRNAMSDMWNAYIADMPAWAMPVYMAKAGKMMRAAHNGDRKALDYMLEFETRGAGSGLFAGDIREMKDQLSRKHGPFRKIQGQVIDKSAIRENAGRLAHYMYRTEREGMSHAQAARIIREAHFDYTDLTEFEQRTMKSIVPFYTWTRKNVPYQIKKIVTRPGRVAVYQKVATNAEKASGNDGYNGPLSVALQGKPLAFRIGDTYVNPAIGLQDLYTTNPFTDQGRQGLIGMMNPGAKIALELLQNKSTFTGQPIYGDEARTQTGPGWLSAIFGGDKTVRNYGQGPQAFPAVPWWANYFGGQVPMGSFALSMGNPAAGARAEPTALNLSPKTISYAFGLQTATPNIAYEQMVAKAEADAKFKVYYKWLQDQGRAPLSQYTPGSHNAQRVDQSTYAAYGGR